VGKGCEVKFRYEKNRVLVGRGKVVFGPRKKLNCEGPGKKRGAA